MDRATFQCFYQETASSLRAYLRMNCRDAALADDLLHDTYLRLLRRRLPELDAAQLKSYLYRTAHSVLVDHFRTRQHEARWRAEQTSPDDVVPDTGFEPTGFGHRSPRGALGLPIDMQRVFDTLKPRQQSLLWLAYVEGFKHDEISQVIGVSSGSVRVLLSRARAELAARLSATDLAPSVARGTKR